MNKKIQIILRKISQYCIYLVLFLVPIFFLPITSDFFEFNKSVIFMILTFTGITTWAFSLDPKGEISIWKSKLDKPTLILIGLTFFSLILSKHFITSLLGFSGTLSNSVTFFFTSIVFAFLTRNVLIGKKSIEKAILSITISGVLVAVLTILQYWGIFIFKYIDSQNFSTFRKFTTLGYEAVLPFFMILLLPLEIYLLNKHKNILKYKIAIISALFVTTYAIIISSGKIWMWPALLTIPLTVLTLFFTLRSLKIKLNLKKKLYIPLLSAISILFIIHNIPFLENRIVTTQSFYSVQPKLSISTSWKILTNQYSDSLKEIIIGSGPDTYAYTFSKYKPESYSNSENAGIRFARSTTQLTEIASNYGILGIAAWGTLIYFAYLTVSKILTTNHESEHTMVLKLFSVEIILLLGFGFFVFYTSIFWILLWFCVGLISTLYLLHFPREAERTVLSVSLKEKLPIVQNQNIVPVLFKIVSTLLFTIFIIFLVKLYTGEVYYSLGKNVAASDAENDSEIVLNYMDSNNHFSDAIKFFKLRDDYYSDRSVIAIKLLSKSIDLSASEEDYSGFTSEQDNIRDLSLESLSSALTLNIVNVKNFKTAVYIYEVLINLTDGEYAIEFLGSINSGLELDPNDPELHHKKGIILSLAGKDGDIEEIERAIELDPLYVQAYLDLALIKHNIGDFASAQDLLEQVVDILDEYELQDLNLYEDLKTNIDDYEKGLYIDQPEFEITDIELENIE